MAKYKLIFTVRDNYGKEKDIEGGTIDVDLNELNSTEISAVSKALDLDAYATDQELSEAITEERRRAEASESDLSNRIDKYDDYFGADDEGDLPETLIFGG